MNISLCIATYKRPQQLDALLGDLTQQTLLPDEVVVVDNEAAGGGRPIVESWRRKLPFPIKYQIQPERGIALTRNLTVHLADGAWLAFIDDDERAPATWLQQLVKPPAKFNADGVLAPVVPIVPDNAPAPDWRGSFYDFPRAEHGLHRTAE